MLLVLRSKVWYSNKSGQEACQMAQAKLNAIQIANSGDVNQLMQGDDKKSKAPESATIDVPATEVEVRQGVAGAVRDEAESIHDFIKRTCVWCARSRTNGTDRATLEFLIRSSGIWLHAFEYRFETSDGENETFRAPLPLWYKE